jgi:hypothetical protein
MLSASGVATGTFQIPANVRCGTVEVILQNANDSAQTTYVAQGTLRTDTEVITKTYVTINLHDPLAESFTFQDDRVVTSLTYTLLLRISQTMLSCKSGVWQTEATLAKRCMLREY